MTRLGNFDVDSLKSGTELEIQDFQKNHLDFNKDSKSYLNYKKLDAYQKFYHVIRICLKIKFLKNRFNENSPTYRAPLLNIS